KQLDQCKRSGKRRMVRWYKELPLDVLPRRERSWHIRQTSTVEESFTRTVVSYQQLRLQSTDVAPGPQQSPPDSSEVSRRMRIDANDPGCLCQATVANRYCHRPILKGPNVTL